MSFETEQEMASLAVKYALTIELRKQRYEFLKNAKAWPKSRLAHRARILELFQEEGKLDALCATAGTRNQLVEAILEAELPLEPLKEELREFGILAEYLPDVHSIAKKAFAGFKKDMTPEQVVQLFDSLGFRDITRREHT